MIGGWAAGAVVNVCGGIAINTGTNSMKLGYLAQEAQTNSGIAARPIWRIWQWQIGCALFSIGNIFNFISFGLASQVVLSALGSVQFVSNVVFAWVVLKEKVSHRVLLATVLIVAGNTILVAFGDKTSPVYNADGLVLLYKKRPFVIYMGLAFAIVGPLAFISYTEGVATMAKDTETFSKTWRTLLPLAYSFYSCIVGAQAVLFSTSISIMIVQSLQGNLQFKSWFFYVCIAGLLLCSVFWISQLNKGLREFPAIVIVPLLQVIWMLLVIISGGIYFGNFARSSKFQLGMFGLGLAILVAGVYCLVLGSHPDSADFEDVAGRRSAEAPPPVIMPLQYQGSLASEIARMESLELARMQSVSTLIKQQSDASSSNQSALLPANTANHVSANRRGSLVLLAENTKAAARQSIFTAVAAVKEATLTAASSQIGMGTASRLRYSSIFCQPLMATEFHMSRAGQQHHNNSRGIHTIDETHV